MRTESGSKVTAWELLVNFLCKSLQSPEPPIMHTVLILRGQIMQSKEKKTPCSQPTTFQSYLLGGFFCHFIGFLTVLNTVLLDSLVWSPVNNWRFLQVSQTLHCYIILTQAIIVVICDSLIAAIHTELKLGFFSFPPFYFFPFGESWGKAATANRVTCWFVLLVSLTLQHVRCIFQHTLKKLIKTILQCKRCRQRLSDTFQECHHWEFSCPTTHPE